tara:strand:- start:143 stop:268 length:126 start_codon:yes stop_codon:yes gene_type:complete
MSRATAAETSKRIDALQGMILEGKPNTIVVSPLRDNNGGIS